MIMLKYNRGQKDVDQIQENQYQREPQVATIRKEQPQAVQTLQS